VAGANLGPILERFARATPGDERVAMLATSARERILNVPIPAAISDAVEAAYASLGNDVPVAVRSSATAEDLPFASFAGQQDTFLNVVGIGPLLDAVRRCWASLWTDRAVAYRASNGIDQAEVRLAVVVQRMVDVEVAGVMFTANPVTGRRRQAVFDASPGLGEAVVSGAVNPDHFVLDRVTGNIVERRLGDKRIVVEAIQGGGTRHVQRESTAEHACLTDAQIRALGKLADKVECLYGVPQDTEFAVDRAGRLWLTQSRPITTLYPLPALSEYGPRIYFSVNVAQGVFRPFTPMGIQAFRLVASGMATLLGHPPADPYQGPSALVEAGDRLFIDATGLVRSRIGRAFLDRFTGVAEARASAIFKQIGNDPRFAPRRTSPLPLIHAIICLLRHTRFPLVAARYLLRPGDARRRVDRLLRGLDTLAVVSPNATAYDHLAAAERELRKLPGILVTILPVMLSGLGAFLLARRLLRGQATGDELQVVLRGLPNNPTTEMDLALWEIAMRVRKDELSRSALANGEPSALARQYLAGDLPPLLQHELSTFLTRYGHRGVAEIDVGLPRWSEDPTHILGTLTNYLRLDRANVVPEVQFSQATREAEAVVSSLQNRAGGLRGALVGVLLRRARALAGYREMPKFLIVLGFARARRHLWSVGRSLVAEGCIQQAEDVFFLTLPEAREGLSGRDLRATVAERRASYEHELLRRHVPRVLLSDGTEPEASLTRPEIDEDGVLRGSPASPGQVIATARVVLDPTGARIDPGEILVGPSTDPGWTPLFLTASGLVMEMGGSMSHGAVVAREYGIPAVVGVANATERIKTGDRVMVDGVAGVVRIMPRDPK
jgi:pyruvate,water dikinase